MISLGIKGFNVSSPFKADIINYLDKIDPAAGKINSVNTVKITNNHLKGYSTDGLGFWQSLKKINTAKTLLIGTGGAARSIMANAANFGVKQLTVVNRYGTNWKQKVISTQKLANVQLHDLNDRKYLTKILKEVDLVINATTVGMKNTDPSLLTSSEISITKRSTVFVDLIYAHQTKFLQIAAAHKRKTLNGIPMLIAQAALSFKIWTGVKGDISIMKKSLRPIINSNNWEQSGLIKI